MNFHHIFPLVYMLISVHACRILTSHVTRSVSRTRVRGTIDVRGRVDVRGGVMIRGRVLIGGAVDVRGGGRIARQAEIGGWISKMFVATVQRLSLSVV